MSDLKIELSGGADHYCNICRCFSMKKVDDKTGEPYHHNNVWFETVVIMSGSDGTSIATKSSNNSHVRLNTNDIKALIKELKHAIGFSGDAKRDSAAHWTAVNNEYENRLEVQKKYKVEE